MLVAASTPFDFVAVEGFDAPGPNRNRILALNPLGQIPVLVLADGQVMTESAAIALHLAETHPGAGLAPPPAIRRARASCGCSSGSSPISIPPSPMAIIPNAGPRAMRKRSSPIPMPIASACGNGWRGRSPAPGCWGPCAARSICSSR
ncbi:glutathione S-transferase N-terminal domain-containing protein [Klebsiella pneumoniae]|uniref:glutathione S-transferase N-terminal domain-containing protein n=1 Tax=Klebsiella pneumoniae TaxID=573 RepID=UPI003970C7FB